MKVNIPSSEKDCTHNQNILVRRCVSYMEFMLWEISLDWDIHTIFHLVFADSETSSLHGPCRVNYWLEDITSCQRGGPISHQHLMGMKHWKKEAEVDFRVNGNCFHEHIAGIISLKKHEYQSWTLTTYLYFLYLTCPWCGITNLTVSVLMSSSVFVCHLKSLKHWSMLKHWPALFSLNAFTSCLVLS